MIKVRLSGGNAMHMGKGKSMRQYDVVVIGAGVSGSAVARELSRKERRIAVLEKACDVCEGTSKANSGIVHAGYDAVPGTLKAKLNVLGNERMESLSRELDFSFKRNGSLVLCFEEEGIPKLEELYERGLKNGVKGLALLSGEEVRKMEPAVSAEVVKALYAPTGGIVCPFGLNIALAENACENGVEFFFNHPVEKIARSEAGYEIEAGGESFFAKIVVNAAGVHADEIHNMVWEQADGISGDEEKVLDATAGDGEQTQKEHRVSGRLAIVARRGQYCLMDKRVGGLVHSTIFQLPSKMGKGILVTPTVHGNLLTGPTAEDIPNKEGVNTTADGLEKVLTLATKSIPGLPTRQVITSFAGLRAHCEGENGEEDFVIGEMKGADGFFDVAGIESPGLTSAPAIGEYVAELINEKYPVPDKKGFLETRKGIPHMAEADPETKKRLIAEDPAYANVICRCEVVTEGEIVNAIRRPLGAKTLDGVKRRTRAGMGRCQAGFCSPRVVEILARELSVDEAQITKAGGDSYFLIGYDKEKYLEGKTDSCKMNEEKAENTGEVRA